MPNHKLHDGPQGDYPPPHRPYNPPARLKVSLAALQWAAEQAGQSYCRFTLSLSPADEARIQAEYDTYQLQRKTDLASRPHVDDTTSSITDEGLLIDDL